MKNSEKDFSQPEGIDFVTQEWVDALTKVPIRASIVGKEATIFMIADSGNGKFVRQEDSIYTASLAAGQVALKITWDLPANILETGIPLRVFARHAGIGALLSETAKKKIGSAILITNQKLREGTS